MGYVALYRAWRPKKFEDLVGQEHIVRTLINQLESGHIAHAYLFAGPRGTGKTSTAKLFARAINCKNPVNGDPCGICDSCRSFEADDNMDIIEIDAASNNGVDSIREIRDKVVFAPAYGRYKVYIIDEVHMLSAGAFNALLKTLEEPPKHAVFILATTEIHKLPATILSRCQRFDFKLIPSHVIAQRLDYVLKNSGASFEKEAIDIIAKSAQGGMRDALSLADVCLSYCGKNVTASDAMSVLGISDRNFLFEFSAALLELNAEKSLELCQKFIAEGGDISVFISELSEHLRDILLCIHCPKSEELLTLPKEILEKLQAQAKKQYSARIIRAIEVLSSLESEIKLHNKPEIQFETGIVKICFPQGEQDIIALQDRITALEEKLASGAAVGVQKNFSDENAFSSDTSKKNNASASDVPWKENASLADNAVENSACREKEIPFKSRDTQKENIFPTNNIAQNAPDNSIKRGVGNGFSEQNKNKHASASAGSELWQQLIKKLQSNDPGIYMMLRKFSGVEENGNFVIYIPESASAKQNVVLKNADTLSGYIKEICSKDMRVTAAIGAPNIQEKSDADTDKNNAENDMMKAALDLFS